MVLAQNLWSNKVSVVQINASGEAEKEMELNGDFRSLSAAGAYVSILFADRLEVYRSNFELSEKFEINGAEKVLQRSDGAAIVIHDYLAELYNS